ncbi:MAG: hypothetical protein QM754_15985 [Tepidisphaeraceae bacterium]
MPSSISTNCAVVGDVADLAGDDAAGRVLLGDAFPRVLLDLLHAERDFLLVLVDLEDLDLDLLALGDDFARVVDALRPGHLGDVDEAFNAGFEFAERAVRHDVDDFGVVNGADVVAFFDVFPRRSFFLLQAEGDLFLVLVDLEHLHFDFLIDLQEFARVVDAAPAHVGDVQQAVDATEVDERAEVGDVLDGALDDGTDDDLVEGLLLEFFTLLFDQLATADNDVAAFVVDLEDDGFDLAADPVADFARTADVDLAGREEDGNADVDKEAALDLLGGLAGDGIAFLLGLHDPFPVDDAVSLALADPHRSGIMIHVFDQDFDFLTDLDVFGFVEFALVEQRLALAAEFDEEFIAADAAHAAVDDAAGGQIDQVFGTDELIHLDFSAAQCSRHHGVSFGIEITQRMKEVVIDHKTQTQMRRRRCTRRLTRKIAATVPQRRASTRKPALATLFVAKRQMITGVRNSHKPRCDSTPHRATGYGVG